MKRYPLNIIGLSYRNLIRKPLRTTCLSALVAVFAFTLFGGSILAMSLKNGLNSTQARLGADIMIIPEGADNKYEGLLLRGTPEAFYFDKETADKICASDGISESTCQFFLTSMNASCCSAFVQLIGFDPTTDFVIQPWIKESLNTDIGDGEIVVGNTVIATVGGTLKFFGREYTVAGKLDKTATGIDTSVFMNMATARKALGDAKAKQLNLLIEADDTVSAILINVKDGYDVTSVARQIEADNKGVEAIVSKNMITNISNNLNILVIYIYSIVIAVWALAVIALFAIFTSNANERKKEYSILRSLGASRKRLVMQLLCESALLSLSGCIVGIISACLVVFPFSTYIGMKLQLPYLLPQLGAVLLTLALSLFLSAAIGPLASAVSAIRIGSSETYLMMREGEA